MESLLLFINLASLLFSSLHIKVSLSPLFIPVEMSKASSLVTLMALLSTIFLGWDTFDNAALLRTKKLCC